MTNPTQPTYRDQLLALSSVQFTGLVDLAAAEQIVIAADREIAAAHAAAPWLTEAHALCADYNIPSGHISDRLKALRAHIQRLEDEAGTFDDCCTKD